MLITYFFDKALMHEIVYILIMRMQNGINSHKGEFVNMLQNYICIYPMAHQLLYMFDIK